jgi:hypothetical protein
MKEKILALIASDAAVPERFFDTFRRSEHLEPEKALLLAILEDAVHCYRKYRVARDRTGRERFHEAEDWIMGGENDWIFSFDNACELLGLDPQYLRRGLRDWSAEEAEPEKPRRRGGLRGQAA